MPDSKEKNNLKPHTSRAVNEADSLGLEDALDVALGVQQQQKKPQVEQVKLYDKDIPDKLKYIPEAEIALKNAVKSDFEGASLGGVEHVASSELYKDVTERILKAQQEAATLTEGDITFFKKAKQTKKDKLELRQKKLEAKATRNAAKNQKQAYADYDTSGAITDKIAQNETYLREANDNRKKKRIIAILLIALILLFLLAFGVSMIVNNVTGFTVNLTGGDHTKGLTLYDSGKLENGSVRLTASDIPECDNITYKDILPVAKETIDKGDANQSKEYFYFAYSFYVQNVGKGEVDYDFKINMTATTKGVDDAVRIMLITDSTYYGDPKNTRKVEVYAKPEADKITGEWKFENGVPKMQKLYNYDGIIFPDVDQDKALPFYSAKMPVLNKVNKFSYKAGQNVHKYTVIIYLEGGDEDCESHIKGGGIKFNAEFTVTDYRVDI